MNRTIVQYGIVLSACMCVVRASAAQTEDHDTPHIVMQEILDLNREGVNVFAFCSSSRELFISHPVACTNLYQWNIAEKKLLHTYSCPKDQKWWADAVVSQDGKLLVAATYPPFGVKAKVLFIDTQSHRTRYTAERELVVRTIKLDHSGKFIWITMSQPGPDPFVYDRDGKKYSEFNPNDFEAETKDRLWDVPLSKGGPPPGLFYRDENGNVHRLINDPLNQHYALTRDGKYIGTSTWDQRALVWRTFDLKELFNEKVGAHPVELLYDSKEDQFLILNGVDGNTRLRAIKLPQENAKGQPDGAANGSQPTRSETNSTSGAAGSRR